MLLHARQLLVSEGDIPFIGFSVMHHSSRALFTAKSLPAMVSARRADLELVKSTEDVSRYLEALLRNLCDLTGYASSSF